MLTGAAAVETGSYSEDSASVCSHGGIYSVDESLVKIDFSSSLNPLGTPALALREIRKRAGELTSSYPDPECRLLKKDLCHYLGQGVHEKQLCIGNGALEVIHWFARSFAKKLAVIPSPTFCEYELASRNAGARTAVVPLHNRGGLLELDVDATVAAARNADALFLCNPNNPTGLLATKSIEMILDRISDSTMVLLDECFIELSDRPSDALVHRITEFKNLVILRSLTKSFALAGLRVGYSISAEPTAERLARSKIHWNVNGIAQAAGSAALRAGERYLASARALISKERRFLREKIGIQSRAQRNSIATFALHSDANFFLVRLESDSAINSTEFRDLLLRKTGVLVRDCSSFGGMGTNYIRVAVKNREQNTRLIKGLETVRGTVAP